MQELRQRKLIHLVRDNETIFNRHLWREFELARNTPLYTINDEKYVPIQNNQRLVQGLIDLIKDGMEVIKDNKKPRDETGKKRSAERRKNKRTKRFRKKLDL